MASKGMDLLKFHGVTLQGLGKRFCYVGFVKFKVIEISIMKIKMFDGFVKTF